MNFALNLFEVRLQTCEPRLRTRKRTSNLLGTSLLVASIFAMVTDLFLLKALPTCMALASQHVCRGQWQRPDLQNGQLWLITFS